jgi:DtxR family Mn-dependent transcriptional regulator
MEDYLEAIMLLEKEQRGATVTSISRFLDVKKPSVTAALSKLSENGLVEHQKYGAVALTVPGRRTARDVYHRHTTLLRFLTDVLGVDSATACDDACKLEHSLSPASVAKLTDFVASAMAERKINDNRTPERTRKREKARIVKINLEGDIRRRLSDMGLVNDAEVQLVRVAPLGDPVEIRIKGYDLSLRKEVVSEIEVEPLSVRLVKVGAGKTVRVSSFSGGTEQTRRLSDMGMIPGAEVTVVENHYPGAMLVTLRGSRLVLSQDLADQVLVREV